MQNKMSQNHADKMTVHEEKSEFDVCDFLQSGYQEKEDLALQSAVFASTSATG